MSPIVLLLASLYCAFLVTYGLSEGSFGIVFEEGAVAAKFHKSSQNLVLAPVLEDW